MSRTAVALLLVALLVASCQWGWARALAHVDPRRIPVHSRRRVAWLKANSTHIEVASAGLFVAVLCAAAASLI